MNHGSCYQLEEADMKIPSGSTTATLLSVMFLATALTAQEASSSAQANPANGGDSVTSSVSSAAASGNSKIRIVRLSEMKGVVQLDRNTGKGFEDAMANLPVTEGAKLETGMGVAEVEFEDNSTLRLATNTSVEFTQLELTPAGVKVSRVKVLKGTVYASMVKSKDNQLTLDFGRQQVNLTPSSHIRLEVNPTEAKLAVLDGSPELVEGSGATALNKKKTLTFNLADQTVSEPTVAKKVEDSPFDGWDNQSSEYHKQYANFTAYGNSPYTYGLTDLNYYGSFISSPGCGSMWRPYLVSSSWDPFSNGTWAWYQGAGYSWVSPYPWGWTPYHYGAWSFCNGVGWGWQPGGSWMGLANTPAGLTRTGTTFNPPKAPRAPAAGQATLVTVNSRPLATSTLSGRDTFVFRNDSAGLGVPRGSLGNLNKVSSGVAQHGAVNVTVFSGQPSGGYGRGNLGASNAGRGEYAGSSHASASAGSYSGSMGHSAGAASGAAGGGHSH
jgi:hypothetical protein